MKVGLIVSAVVLTFYTGMRVERFLHMDTCLDAGGRVGERGLCEGAR